MSKEHIYLHISQLCEGYDANRIAGMVEGIVGSAVLVSSACLDTLELELPCRCNVFTIKDAIDNCLGCGVDVKQLNWCNEEVASICK